jgi:hypothetical protein
MKVLALETHSKDYTGKVRTSAIDYYRIYPLLHTSLDVTLVKEIVHEGEDPEQSWHRHKDIDILYSSYIDAPKAYAYLAAAKHKYGFTHIMDLDDNLFDVSPLSPAYERYKPFGDKKFYAEMILKDVDVLTVTNQHLKEVVKSHGRTKPIHVVPNYIDLHAYHQDTFKKMDKKINILYQGSSTHQEDLEGSGFIRAMKYILDKYGKKVKFTCIGMPALDLESHPRYRYIQGSTDFPVWLEIWKKYTALSDFAVAPLINTPFNLCKSPIKYFEYSAAKLPGIYSDVPTYNFIKHGLLTKNTVQDWINALETMMKGSDLGERAYEDIQQYEVRKHAKKWEDICIHGHTI